MISYEKLESLINIIKRYDEFEDKFNKLVINIDSDFISSLFLFSDYRSAVVEVVSLLLEGGKEDAAMDDTFSYWIYELEFGTKYKEGCMTEADGTNIKIEKLQDVYDYYKKEFWLEEECDGK